MALLPLSCQQEAKLQEKFLTTDCKTAQTVAEWLMNKQLLILSLVLVLASDLTLCGPENRVLCIQVKQLTPRTRL